MTRDLLKKQEETVHRHVANFNVSHSKTSEVEPKLKTHLHNQVAMHLDGDQCVKIATSLEPKRTTLG